MNSLRSRRNRVTVGLCVLYAALITLGVLAAGDDPVACLFAGAFMGVVGGRLVETILGPMEL